jgi:hypothetical protein
MGKMKALAQEREERQAAMLVSRRRSIRWVREWLAAKQEGRRVVLLIRYGEKGRLK